MLEIVVFMLLYGLGGQVGGVCVLLFYTKGEKNEKTEPDFIDIDRADAF